MMPAKRVVRGVLCMVQQPSPGAIHSISFHSILFSFLLQVPTTFKVFVPAV